MQKLGDLRRSIKQTMTRISDSCCTLNDPFNFIPCSFWQHLPSVVFSEMELLFSSEVYYDVTRMRWWRHTYVFIRCFLSRLCLCWVMLPTKLNELSEKGGRRPLCYIFSPIGFCENARPNWKEFNIMPEKSLIFHSQNFYYHIRYIKRAAFCWKLDINWNISRFFTCSYKEYRFIRKQEISNGT